LHNYRAFAFNGLRASFENCVARGTILQPKQTLYRASGLRDTTPSVQVQKPLGAKELRAGKGQGTQIGPRQCQASAA